jgi:hypothetical protein
MDSHPAAFGHGNPKTRIAAAELPPLERIERFRRLAAEVDREAQATTSRTERELCVMLAEYCRKRATEFEERLTVDLTRGIAGRFGPKAIGYSVRDDSAVGPSEIVWKLKVG